MATTLPIDSAERKEVPLYRALFRLFPAALVGCARWVKFGNDKHCPGGPLQHAREISGDHEDCILRHLMDLEEDFGAGKGRDENGNPQVDAIVWRAMALAQEWHEANSGAPVAPAAIFPKRSIYDQIPPTAVVGDPPPRRANPRRSPIYGPNLEEFRKENT